MILLPRGNPVKENLDPGRLNLPDALQKLRAGSFTGYLRFEAPQGTAVFILVAGKTVSALLEAGGERVVGQAAFARTFELSLAGGVRLDIYRLSPELAMSVHALLHGDVLYRGQELKLIDIRALLGKLKEDRLTGCLRIYTGERIALIFYRDGNPLGFFHDGSTDIETAADTSMSVARLPGAKIDVLSTAAGAAEELDDLAAAVDLVDLWQKAKERLVRERRVASEEASRSREQQEAERRQKTLAFLRGTAERHVGKIGVSLVEKEFEKLAQLSEGDIAGFYDRLAKGAKLVAGPSAVNAMLDEMKRGVTALLK